MASAVHERYVPFQHDGSHAPLLRSYSSTSEEPLDDEELLLQPPSRWSQWKAEAESIYVQGKGMILVTFAQFFAANMNVMTKYLEMDGPHGPGMDPFQILFARMSITVVASYLYMLYARVPDPFGRRGVLGLLTLRAVGGFFGVFGLYYSVKYLDLSEATVLTFLAPILTCYATSRFMPHESFGWKQQLAGLVSLGGVVLIAQPFSPKNEHQGKETEVQHLLAILLALVGVLGATCAYTTLRLIGKQVHPLVSVTYFSAYTTVISCIAMLVIPTVAFRFPDTAFQWALLIGLGVCGFLLQFLLAAGLAYVPPPPPPSAQGSQPSSPSSSAGNRATSMVYTQMLFALVYDKLVWGKTLSPMSWAGSGLILVSAIYVAVARDENKTPVVTQQDREHEHEHEHVPAHVHEHQRGHQDQV